MAGPHPDGGCLGARNEEARPFPDRADGHGDPVPWRPPGAVTRTRRVVRLWGRPMPAADPL
jgi:hypothetical protein